MMATNIERISIRQGIRLLLLLMLLTAGCQPQATPSLPESGTTVQVPPTGSTSSTPLELPTEAVIPAVTAADQEVQAGTIKIDEVVSQNPGWLVIYSQEGGGLGRVLGYVPVTPGSTRNLAVKLKENQELAAGVTYAVLHLDAGETGVFEFPGPDRPAVVSGKTIWTQFRISAALSEPAQAVSSESVAAATSVPAGTTPSPAEVTETAVVTPAPTSAATASSTPSVIIVDQAIRGGSVKAVSVSIEAQGFLAIRNQNLAGSYGAVIGWTAVNPGLTEDVIVNIDVSRATKTLYGVLHTDTDPIGTLEFPGPDQPVLAQEAVVAQPFMVTEGLVGTNITIKSSGGETPYLVDGMGMSIYTSLQDRPGVSNCTGDCRLTWLPVLAMGRLLPGEGVTIQKFGIIVYRNKNRQVTYSGMPLYYYVGDQKPGDTLGQGMDELWFLAAP